jgi:hypothetical protein
MSRLAFVLVLGFASVAVAQPAPTGTPAEAEAQKLLAKGNELLESGDYVGALDTYRNAYAKYPGAKILINIGTALHNLGRNAEAVDTYYKYLNEPGADPTRKPEIQKTISELSAGLGTLHIDVNEPGTHVMIDGRDLGPSPQSMNIRVDPGTHMIAAQKQGFTQESATVNINAGDERQIDLKLAPSGGSTSPNPNTEPSAHGPGTEAPSSTQKIVGLSIGAAGLIAAGVGVALGFSAKSSYNDAVSGHCNMTAMTCDPIGGSEIDSALSRGRVATVLTVVGAAAIAGGLVVYLTAPHPERGSVAIVPTGTGFLVSGGF